MEESNKSTRENISYLNRPEQDVGVVIEITVASFTTLRCGEM